MHDNRVIGDKAGRADVQMSLPTRWKVAAPSPRDVHNCTNQQRPRSPKLLCHGRRAKNLATGAGRSRLHLALAPWVVEVSSRGPQNSIPEQACEQPTAAVGGR